MFNNSGHSAHIRPIIGCKGNICIAGCQTNGLAVATMYGFALYALSERFRLRRFAIVHETGIRNFKGLIKCSQNNLRKCNLRNRRTYFRMVLGTEERHWLPHQRQMLPRKCKAVGLCKTSLFFASRTLGTAGTASVDNATPDHLLPQAATSLQIHCYKRTTDLLCRQKKNNQ